MSSSSLHQSVASGYLVNLRTNSKPYRSSIIANPNSNKEYSRQSESLPRIPSLPTIIEPSDRSTSGLMDWLIGKPFASPPPEKISKTYENSSYNTNTSSNRFQTENDASDKKQQQHIEFSTPPHAQPEKSQRLTISQFIDAVSSPSITNAASGLTPSSTKKFHHRKYLSETNFDNIVKNPSPQYQASSLSYLTVPTSFDKLETMNSTAEEEQSPIQVRRSTQFSEHLPIINTNTHSTSSYSTLPSISNINSSNLNSNSNNNDTSSPLLRESSNQRSSSGLLSPFSSAKWRPTNESINASTAQSIKDSLLQHSLVQQPTATAQQFFTPQRTKIKSKTTILDLKSMIHAKADFPLISRTSGIEQNQKQPKWNSPQAINDFLLTQSQQHLPTVVFARSSKKAHSLIDSQSSSNSSNSMAPTNSNDHFLRRSFVARNPSQSMIQSREGSESKYTNEEGEFKVKSILKAKQSTPNLMPIKKKSIKIEETLNIFHVLDKKN